MEGNQLSGSIPHEFSQQVQNGSFSLDLSQNQLTGGIPRDLLQQFNTSPGCASFNLSFNRLTGSIPRPAAPGSCITYLDFSHNNLDGPVPAGIFSAGSGTFAFTLLLNNNQLSGDVVDLLNGILDLHSIVEVQLQQNMFTRDLALLSTGDRRFSSQIFDVSYNDLRWSTSEENYDPIRSLLEDISSYTYLTEFRAGGNNFVGTPLPTSCFIDPFDAQQFRVLNLSNSHIKGEILSAAFNSSCVPYLQFLDLSYNDIDGSVPETIVQIPVLEILDISYNELSGRLPRFPENSSLDTNPKYFVYNDGLCGYPLDACVSAGGSSRLQWWVLFMTVAGSVAVALISCLGATWRWRVYRKRHQQDEDLIEMLTKRDAATLMPLRELRRATDNFAHSAQIGQGGFGTVYMGKLDDGTTVAIKRSKREGSEENKEQFLNEVKILCQVNHRNLVKLIGCCMENKVAVLVFEFVSNGTLQQHLQGKIEAVHLTWKQRVNIAVQTADALHYLHSAATFPIYHRDVKSANILLDDDLNAKVADFGVSRLASLQATHVSTVAVQGTIGYIDPEYFTSYQFTNKSDVYNFGVVPPEVISAKPALDFRRGGDETSLVNFASPYMAREDLEGLVDPAVMETYMDLAGQGRKSILSMGRLAMRCVDMQARARPSMNEVLKDLQELRFELDGTSPHLECVKRDDDWDAHFDQSVFLSEAFFGDSSRFTTDSDDSGIQLSQL